MSVRALGVATGERLIEILRLRHLDHQPMILETILVSQQRFPDLADLPNTLYEFMEMNTTFISRVLKSK